MSQFTTPLNAVPISDDQWILLTGFEYHVGSYPSKEIILVPEGFVTDFASIPKIFQPIIKPDGPHAKAAVIHDYCYYTACYSKIRSDQIFLEAMRVLNIEEWKRNVMFTAVLLFGWCAWYKHRWRERKNK